MPVIVTSGYRTVEYNRELYAARNQPPTDSQHCYGRAADIKCLSLTASELHAAIYNLYLQGRIRIGGLGKYNSFVHVDVRPTTGHLAQWDKSTTGDDNGVPGGGKAAS